METTTHAPAGHDHHDHHEHHGHEMPTSGRALSGLAVSATAHCLTGCAIGEIAGLAIGTALGWSDAATIALAVGLAFLFGYTLTSLPLLRAGMTLAAVAPIAFAADTFSIAVMEIVDNGVMLLVPGAMEAGLGDAVFWGALSFALAVAFVVAFPVNRWLISRGKGHAVMHEHHGDGDGGHDMGPMFHPRRVLAIVSTMFLAGGAVVVVNWDDEDAVMAGHGGAAETATASDEPGGLASAQDGLRLSARPTRLSAAARAAFSFRILDEAGRPVRDFEIESARRMHVIAVRRDATGFQHLHPRMSADGTWTTSVDFRAPGAWRVFADFQVDGERRTLATDVLVPGRFDPRPRPAPSTTADAGDGYRVTMDSRPDELRFEVTRDGRPVTVQPYLGARGHLVALREGDLAYLHVHPERSDGREIAFGVDYPSAGTYRLFLQFRHDGRVRTASLTQRVSG